MVIQYVCCVCVCVCVCVSAYSFPPQICVQDLLLSLPACSALSLLPCCRIRPLCFTELGGVLGGRCQVAGWVRLLPAPPRRLPTQAHPHASRLVCTLYLSQYLPSKKATSRSLFKLNCSDLGVTYSCDPQFSGS